LLISSCSNTKHLAAGQSLFAGSKVHIKDNGASAAVKKKLVTDLNGLVRPKPNSKLFGMRLKLSLYNMAGVPRKKKGLRHWLREKVGEPPVLASSVHLPSNKALMVNLLQNRGFFDGTVTAHFDTGKKKLTTAVFDVTTGPQYTILNSYFEKDSSKIARDIDSSFSKTLLKPGAPYDLDLIKGERTRIDEMLKEKGYYFFKADYLIVLVDSSIGNNKVNMYVKLKGHHITENAENQYDINNVFIYADYKLSGTNEDTGKDGKVAIGNFYVIDKNKAFKPIVFSRALTYQKGDKYKLDDQNASLSRLVNMGDFKFVKNRFDPISDSLLDVYYYLTPYPKKALTFQAGPNTQNDDRDGVNGSITWKNRNIFKGGEQLLIKLNGGFEAQVGGPVKEPDIYDLGAETDLSFPRFIVPFVDIRTDSRYLPRSIIKLKYDYESESDLLRINSYTASYGYDWKQGPHTEHQLYPINLTYVKTDTFATGGRRDSIGYLYGNLLFSGIILGPTYEYTYNSQVAGFQKVNSYYFDGLVDLSGNILGIAERADYNKNPQTLLGSTYAQYVKLQPDFRYYRRVSRAATVASRIMMGIGIPYGNSEQLPNIKQFWAGGNSDLRGFPSRLVGPGTFNEYSANYFEALGDMKLEGNVELRQALYKFISLGVFAEAGNIWLYHSNPLYPGGQFTPDFYKQLAADVGFGLRFDFKILLLRLDLGMPVRDPWITQDGGWVINDIKLEDPTWKRQNLVYNLAIGYPF
jgi:outer membrane protein insertion porin family